MFLIGDHFGGLHGIQYVATDHRQTRDRHRDRPNGLLHERSLAMRILFGLSVCLRGFYGSCAATGSQARISQLRRTLHKSWNMFQGGSPLRSSRDLSHPSAPHGRSSCSAAGAIFSRSAPFLESPDAIGAATAVICHSVATGTRLCMAKKRALSVRPGHFQRSISPARLAPRSLPFRVQPRLRTRQYSSGSSHTAFFRHGTIGSWRIRPGSRRTRSPHS